MNKEMAWLLGYLLSDGSIVRPKYRKKGDETHLCFICKHDDREVLNKVKTILKTKADVHEYPDYKSPHAKIRVYDRKDIVQRYGDIKIRVPEDDIAGNTRHFIRGLFDGDGTLSYRKSRNTFRIGFIDEYQNITQWVADTICKELFLPEKKARHVPQSNVWECLWEGNIARVIAYWLYSGDVFNCVLPRKKKKYEHCVLNDRIYENADAELLVAAKATIDDNGEITFNLPHCQTLNWCKRLQKLLSFNTAPVFHNKGQKKYYHLHIPDKNLVANMRGALNHL